MSLVAQEKFPNTFKKYFNSLPFLEQAGFFLWPSIGKSELNKNEIKLFKKIKPSGCILFKRNFTDFAQGKILIANVKKNCERANQKYKMPFIVSIDEEGGRVSRLPLPFLRGKPALEFSDNNDELGLVNQVLHQTFVAKGLGINCILSPVADILTEPTNPVMGDRCFGRDALTVLKYSSLVNKTLLSEQIFSCAKHFPGHGNTKTDSHKEFSTSDVSLTTLKTREWIPFKNLIAEKIPFIMAAHVIVPELDPKFPATLSYEILTKQLKKNLKFKGLVLSDDLRMNAIANFYQQSRAIESSITETNPVSLSEEDSYLEQAAIDALLAGCDILLSCQSIEREARIAYSIAKKLKNDKLFHKLMLEKAWKIFSTLTKTQKI
ncbi:glycoside hydrolase family 3 N-terminal domain-containing protein [Fluviispira sanaruensis]|uniref:beta-N-acetylhexosaminidase n=1 Tax=Fluviispira sanaruensis TaxID=2493639 RepID=A0A4P2VWF5_FLUSA|nr:glycoside hydrolase family 3 N-terminal domain-containing protein [Fluviispira sanaruensis]BBH53282.1 beta-N-acetylhexosaminidase [Fluviispira sanaruensis]